MIKKDLLEEILAVAMSTGADFAEVFAENTRTNSIQFADKKIDCNLSYLPSGIYYFALISREYQLKQYLKLIKQ